MIERSRQCFSNNQMIIYYRIFQCNNNIPVVSIYALT